MSLGQVAGMISGLGIVLLVSEPQHAALDLFVSPECRQTHTSQFFEEKREQI